MSLPTLPQPQLQPTNAYAAEVLHGSKLPAFLKALQEEEVEVSVEASGGDSGESEAPIECSSKEGKLKPGDVGENVKSILCCICSKRVLDRDTVVQCSHDDKQCEAIARASCAGYTTVVLPELNSYVQTTGLANCYKALNLSLNLSLRGTILLLVPKGNNNLL